MQNEEAKDFIDGRRFNRLILTCDYENMRELGIVERYTLVHCAIVLKGDQHCKHKCRLEIVSKF